MIRVNIFRKAKKSTGSGGSATYGAMGGQSSSSSTAVYASEAGHAAKADVAKNLDPNSKDWAAIDAKASAALQAAKTYADQTKLSKTGDDTAQGVITFAAGWIAGAAGDLWGWVKETIEGRVGTGWAWFKHLLTDSLEALSALIMGDVHVTGGDLNVEKDEQGNGGNIAADADISAGGDLSGRDVRARGDLSVTGNASIGGTTTMDTAVARNVTAETLTVTKSAHFFELVIDKIKAAGGSVVLSPADGFRVDQVQQKAIRRTDRITYGNGLGCASKMENYIVCELPTVNIGDAADDFLHCPFTANKELSFEYTAPHDGLLMMYRYNASWSSWQAEYMPAGSDEWEAMAWPVSATSRSLNSSTGVFSTQSSANYVCGWRFVRAGDRIRLTGLADRGRSVVLACFKGKYAVASNSSSNQLLVEAVVRNANLNHLSGTSNTNQRRKLDYRTGELWSSTYGNANIHYVTPYILVDDVDTITFRLGAISTNGAKLCAYDEDFNYIQENSVAQPNVTTEITWTKAPGTRWVRLSSRWDLDKDNYYIYLNDNRTEPQTVRYLNLPYCEFQNVESVKIYADLRYSMFHNPDVLVFDGVAAKDYTGRGGLYDRLSSRLFTGISDDYAAEGSEGDVLQSHGTRLLWRAAENADGTGKAMQNMWRAGDQALCQTFNAAEGTTFSASNKYWWAVVSEVGTTSLTPSDNSDNSDNSKNSTPHLFHYIDVGALDVDGTLDCEEGDEVAMLGYRGTDDPERQGAVYMAAYNSIDTSAHAPMVGIYAGINDFALSTHRVALISPTAVSFLSELFRMESRGGGELPQMNMRGAWTPGMSCARWDAVSYDGELWLCILPAGVTTTQPPSATATETVEGTAVPAWELLVARGTSGDDAVLLTLEPQVVEITERYEITPATSSADSSIRTWLDVANGDVLARAVVSVGGTTIAATAAATDSPEFTSTSGDAVTLSDQATLLSIVNNLSRPVLTVLVTVRAVVEGETVERAVPLTIYVNRLGKTVQETIGDITTTIRTRGYVTEQGMESYTNQRISSAEADISTISHKVDGIETDVSTLQQTADSIVATVSSLKVGGRNLLLNADFAAVSSGTPSHFSFRRSSFSGKTAITTGLPVGFSTGLQLAATRSTCVLSMVRDPAEQPYMVMPSGRRFMLSFWVKTSVGGVPIAVTYKAMTNASWTAGTAVVVQTQRTAAADTWERMVFAFDGKGFSPDSLHIGPQQTCTMSITGLQLEEGTIATDWRRAEQDFRSEISQLADRIDLAVYEDDMEACGVHLDGQKKTITLKGDQTVIDGDLSVKGLFTNAVREIRWDETFTDGYEWPDGATAQQYAWQGFVHEDTGTMVVPIDLKEVKSVKTRGISGAISTNAPSYNMHPIVVLPAYDIERIDGMSSAYPFATVQESGVRISVTNSIHLRYRGWKKVVATGSGTTAGLAVWGASALICADPRLLRYASYQSGAAMPTPTATVTATGTNPSIKSCFVANGEYAKFLALPPGQTVTLVSSVERLGDTEDAVPYVVWYVENAEAFSFVKALMTIRLIDSSGNLTGEKDYLFSTADHYSSLGILAPPSMTIPAAAVGDGNPALLIELQQGRWPARINTTDTLVS